MSGFEYISVTLMAITFYRIIFCQYEPEKVFRFITCIFILAEMYKCDISKAIIKLVFNFMLEVTYIKITNLRYTIEYRSRSLLYSPRTIFPIKK